MKLYEYQRSRSLRFNIFNFFFFFCTETARPIEAKSHMEPLWGVRNENLFKITQIQQFQTSFSYQPQDQLKPNFM